MKKKIFAASLAAVLCLQCVSVSAAPHSSSSSVSWTGANEITSSATVSSPTYSSTSADQNAVLINTSGTVTITDPTVTKSGGTSASDNYSFYGINSAVMCKGGGTTTISGGTVTTSAAGANGIFSYGANSGQTNAAGDGTTVKVSDMIITTTGNGSGGIMTTYGGTTYAENLTITTDGGSSAPIRTDRGGGWVYVDGGTYTSNGQGSPAIYSTADVNVSNATLVSNASEGVCIEGTGSIELTDCDLTATNSTLNGNAQFYDTIMIYQSQSGDASSGTSSFTMTGGSLTSNNGDVFHVTNTTAEINLDSVSIINNDADGVLLSVCDDGWSGGSNAVTLTANDQELEGIIQVGSDSSLTLSLTGSSTFTGSFSGSISNDKGSVKSSSLGTVAVTLADEATIVLTADTAVSSLSGSGYIDYNGYTLTVGSTSYSSGDIGSISETSGTDDEHVFKDVVSGSFYYDAVYWALEKEITTGTTSTTFSPNLACTRAQIVTFLWRLDGFKSNTVAENPFTDIDEGTYYYDAVLWAYEKGITTGTTDTTFSPDSPCLRGQAVTFLYRYFEEPDISGTDNPFTDVSEDMFYYLPVLWAYENGITTGTTDTTFSPDYTCLRSQIVTLLYRAAA